MRILTNEKLVGFLIKEGYLKTPLIIKAFKKIDRADFVSDDLKEASYENIPLPIGFGQTISQPLTVAFMLELLQPKKGERILDIGFGSGYLSALLACCLGKEGKVYAVEIIKELYDFGRQNLAKYNFLKSKRVETFLTNGYYGLEEIARKIKGFDGIIAGASAEEISPFWKEQIKEGGRIVAPVRNSILFLKKEKGRFLEKEFFGFSFVPLVK